MEKFFDLTDLPAEVCAVCAVDYVIQHESGACAVFCRHTGAAYMKLTPNHAWHLLPQIADVPHLARALQIAVALNKTVAMEQAKDAPVQ